MIVMLRTCRQLATDDTGATAIEYALLAAMIAAVILTTVGSLGTTVGQLFGTANSELITYMPATATP